MCSMTQECLYGIQGRSKVYIFTLRTNICSETLSKKIQFSFLCYSYLILILTLCPSLSKLICSLLLFLSLEFAALAGLSLEREFILFVTQIQMVRSKNALGLDGSEVCGGHFLFRGSTLHLYWLPGSLYLSPRDSSPYYTRLHCRTEQISWGWPSWSLECFSSILFPGLVELSVRNSLCTGFEILLETTWRTEV